MLENCLKCAMHDIHQLTQILLLACVAYYEDKRFKNGICIKAV